MLTPLVVPKTDAITIFHLINHVWRGLPKNILNGITQKLRIPVYHIHLTELSQTTSDYVCTLLTEPPNFVGMKEEDLHEFVCMIEDISHYYNQHKKTINAYLGEKNSNSDECKSILMTRHELATRYKELQSENKKLSKMVDGNKQNKSKNQTKAATAAASDKSVGKWKEYARAFVKVALYCVDKEMKDLTRSDINKICRKCSVDLNGAALEELRKALPPEFIRREAGAPSTSKQE